MCIRDRGVLIPVSVKRFLSHFVCDIKGYIDESFSSYVEDLNVIFYSDNLELGEIDSIFRRLHDVDAVVLFLYDAIFNRQQFMLYEKLREQFSLYVVVSDVPYDLRFLGGRVPVYLTYGINPIQFQVLLRVLFGMVKPLGKLPVDIEF